MTPDEVHELAEMYRNGLHDLNPWWSPDVNGMVNPLDDPEVQDTVRGFVRGHLTRLETLRNPIEKEE